MAAQTTQIERPHIPVLLEDVLSALRPADKEVYVDGTFGNGGYSKAILEAATACELYGIDRDPNVSETAQDFENRYKPRFHFLKGSFSNLKALLAEAGVEAVDGIVLDIGVSSMQIDQAERGFSFKKDGPLDMRMSAEGPSAADLVNGLGESEIADLLYRYGDERKSRQIAARIVERRELEPFSRTQDLAELIRGCFPPAQRHGKIDPATRSFQALRIAVNDELGELEAVLEQSLDLLKDGGRLVVVSFHSLEDGIVKNFLKKHSAPKKRTNKYAAYSNIDDSEPQDMHYPFELITHKPITADKTEQAQNPRARSAKLRAAIRTRTHHEGGSA